MADELVFYSNPMSRGRIARWMLEEVGAPYRIQWLTYDGSMKAPDYLALNPMGIKGLGEIGIVGVPAAIANAVYHATGKRVRDLPITLDKLARDA